MVKMASIRNSLHLATLLQSAEGHPYHKSQSALDRFASPALDSLNYFCSVMVLNDHRSTILCPMSSQLEAFIGNFNATEMTDMEGI